MRIGFTGSRGGLTNDQLLQLHALTGDLKEAGATQATHGMCVGADEAFHQQVKAFKYFIIGCPGVSVKYGIVEPYMRSSSCLCDLVMPEKPYLVRNQNIVNESDIMIACPSSGVEQLRGGTWATVRYARKRFKPVVLLWPDGSSTVERVPGVETVEKYRQWLLWTAELAKRVPLTNAPDDATIEATFKE